MDELANVPGQIVVAVIKLSKKRGKNSKVSRELLSPKICVEVALLHRVASKSFFRTKLCLASDTQKFPMMTQFSHFRKIHINFHCVHQGVN